MTHIRLGMAAREDSKAIRAEMARRYAEWVSAEMDQRAWDQAMLARRSNLPKQTVNTIVNAAAPQPTAAQVASLAKAFRIRPEDVLAGIGLWPKSSNPDAPDPALTTLYSDLDDQRRRTFLRIGYVLREEQEGYGAEPTTFEDRLREGEIPADAAAVSDTDESREAKRDAEDTGDDPA